MPKIKKLFAEFVPDDLTEQYDTAIRRLFMQNAPTPSGAIFAMIKGIKKQLKNKKFRITMNTFGFYNQEQKICEGCAATCTLIELSQASEEEVLKSYKFMNNVVDPRKVGRKVYGDNIHTIHAFEEAIDGVRRGKLTSLLYWYGYQYIKQIPKMVKIIYDHTPIEDCYMVGHEEKGANKYWLDALDDFDKTAKFMQKNGL